MGVGYIATMTAFKAAEVTGNYGANVIGGHMGMKALKNTVDNFGAAGGYVFGKIGNVAGRALGYCAAGNHIDKAAAISNNVSESIQGVTNFAINLAKRKVELNSKEGEGSESDINWKAVALETGQLALNVGIAAGATALGLGVYAPVFAAGVNAIPQMLASLKEEVKDSENLALADVITPIVQNVLIEGAASLAGGYTSHKMIDNAYSKRVGQFQNIGKVLDKFTPNVIKGTFESVGRAVGHLDAGRFAMSADNIKSAQNGGAVANSLVKVVGGYTISSLKNNPDDGLYTKAAKVTGAVLIGGAFVAVAPQAAVVAGGVAAMKVAPLAIKYGKALFGYGSNSQKVAAEKCDEFVKNAKFEGANSMLASSLLSEGDMQDIMKESVASAA